MHRFSSLARFGGLPLVRPSPSPSPSLSAVPSIRIPPSHPFACTPRHVPLFHPFVTQSFSKNSSSPASSTPPSTSPSASASISVSSSASPPPPPPDPDPSSNQQSDEEKRAQRKRWIGIILFTSCALITAQLGIWQLQRREWKRGLITTRGQQLKRDPVSLDELLKDSAAVEHRRVRVRGKLLYDKTMRVGYRAKPGGGSIGAEGGVGHFLITPMILEDERIILINRGWCSREQNYKHQKEPTHSDGTVEVVGVVVPGEPRPQYLGEAERAKDEAYVFVDVPSMLKEAAIVLGPDQRPILIDALDVILRDRIATSISPLTHKRTEDYLEYRTMPQMHAIYATTWFTLSGFLFVLTYLRFRRQPTQRSLRPSK